MLSDEQQMADKTFPSSQNINTSFYTSFGKKRKEFWNIAGLKYVFGPKLLVTALKWVNDICGNQYVTWVNDICCNQYVTCKYEKRYISP